MKFFNGIQSTPFHSFSLIFKLEYPILYQMWSIVLLVLHIFFHTFKLSNHHHATEVIDKLQNECKMEPKVEEDVAGFLGVYIQDHSSQDRPIKLTQPSLSKQVIKALDIGHLPSKENPAVCEPTVRDEDSDPPEGGCDCCSVIRMLHHLQGHSKPDVTFAVSSCVRFVHGTKRSHKTALVRIGQCPKRTMNEGLIMKPDPDHFTLDVCVDSDFAGLWPCEDKDKHASVKSRVGCVTCLSDCPMVWGSRVIKYITLSTMEADHLGLSTQMVSGSIAAHNSNIGC